MSGCINLSGVVRVRTTKSFGESTVSKIYLSSRECRQEQVEERGFITRFARVYTPIRCFRSHCPGFIPPFLGSNRIVGEGTFGENFPLWLNRA